MNANLVDVVQWDDGVKKRVEIVEQVDHLDGLTERGDGCKTHDVTEVQRDYTEMFRLHGLAELQRLGHSPGRRTGRLKGELVAPTHRSGL